LPRCSRVPERAQAAMLRRDAEVAEPAGSHAAHAASPPTARGAAGLGGTLLGEVGRDGAGDLDEAGAEFGEGLREVSRLLGGEVPLGLLFKDAEEIDVEPGV